MGKFIEETISFLKNSRTIKSNMQNRVLMIKVIAKIFAEIIVFFGSIIAESYRREKIIVSMLNKVR